MSEKRAIVYCRVSSGAQDNPQFGTVSLQAQEVACREYCRKEGISIEDVIYEVQSGRDISRQRALQGIVRKVEQGTVLVFYNVTRFSRHVHGALDLIKKIYAKGGKIYAVTEACSYDNAAHQHLFRTTLCVAQNESENLSQRIKNSVAYRKARGDAFGPAPFGKKVAREKNGKRIFVPCLEEQKVIKQIKDMHYQKTAPLDIAYQLNKKKLYYRSRDWTTNLVKNVIVKHCHLDMGTLNRAIKNKEMTEALNDIISDAKQKSMKKRGVAPVESEEDESESSESSESAESSEEEPMSKPPAKKKAVPPLKKVPIPTPAVEDEEIEEAEEAEEEDTPAVRKSPRAHWKPTGYYSGKREKMSKNDTLFMSDEEAKKKSYNSYYM